MRLTIVGCSGSVPGPRSACSCYLVEEEGYRLLLDLGVGASGPLQRYAEPHEIDTVIVSHAHADHWYDLTQLGYMRTRVGHDEPVRVIGPSNMPEVLLTNPDIYIATAARPGELKLGPLTARLAHVMHGTMECWATRIGDALCYTADSLPCPALDDLAAGCRVLLAEAADFEANEQKAHLTAADAGRLAARSGAELLILTHLRSWHDHRALLAEASRYARCPVILAQPGLRLSV